MSKETKFGDNPWDTEQVGHDYLLSVYGDMYNKAVELAEHQRSIYGLNKKETQKLITPHIENMIKVISYIALLSDEGDV